ncbi:uncharacterized protein TNCV_4125491 [Trichonephila clavipes]|nr:uncharacterized protein TNCV_4125491 [Trichonephila clavipes]
MQGISPGLKYPKVMAYYYGTTYQNVTTCSSVDWKTLQVSFGSSPIGRTCMHYSVIADDTLVTLTSLVKMWMPQQKVLWLTEFKSVTRVQRRVPTECNVVTGLPNRLMRIPIK